MLIKIYFLNLKDTYKLDLSLRKYITNFLNLCCNNLNINSSPLIHIFHNFLYRFYNSFQNQNFHQIGNYLFVANQNFCL